MSLDKIKYCFFSPFFLSRSHGRKIAYLGIFIALSIVVNMFSIDVTAANKITFTYLVAFFAGAFFGSVPGFTIMFLGDLLGFFLFPSGGVYWFLTNLASGFFAFIPGLIMNGVHFSFKGAVFVKAGISVVLMFLLGTCGLGAFANYAYVKEIVYHGEYSKTFWVYLVPKISFASIVSVINYVVVFALIPVVNHIKGLKITLE